MTSSALSAPKPKPAVKKKRVLLIDDSKDDGVIIKRYLTSDYSFAHVLDERDIIPEIKRETPDCILIDYNLLKTDGIKVLSKLSKIDRDKPIAYIFLTAHETLDIAIRALKSGAHDFLVKSEISRQRISTSIKIALKKAEDEYKTKYLASHDTLTHVWNRAFFEKQLKIQIERHNKQKALFALIYVDLDHFKQINDTYGHDTGDKVLIKTAEILKNNIRKDDIISRLGGDEFIILIKDIKKPENARIIVNQLRNNFIRPFKWKDQSIFIMPSMGSSVFPINGSTPEDILKSSDIALYKAKKEGRDRYQRFERAL